MNWTHENMPDLTGKSAIVTGASSGLGFEIALALAAHHCRVILGCRSLEKATVARDAIIKKFPQANVNIQLLDLSSFQSIHDFISHIKSQLSRVDLLINNAATLNVTPGKKTNDGFNLIMQTNCLGPFALTAQLMPLLEAAGNARIVTVGSGLHRFASLHLNDLKNSTANNLTIYSQSKLANLIFAFELANRLKQSNSQVMSVAAHPGIATSHLSDAKGIGTSKFIEKASILVKKLFGQSAAQGALPMLYAATAPSVSNGEFYGPDGWLHVKGYPKKLNASNNAYDHQLACALWEECETMTNTQFNIEGLNRLTPSTLNVLNMLEVKLDEVKNKSKIANNTYQPEHKQQSNLWTTPQNIASSNSEPSLDLNISPSP